ncbi:sugar transferase [Candidatus Latescibacterota bacterium]
MKYFYKKYGKRIFDLCCVIPGLILITPLLIIISILVYIKHGSLILFRQARPGFNCKPFTIYKFRTMKKLYDNNGNLLSDEERLTPLGHFLRVTSLDELPELFNVLKGDMSLVGPRPLLMEYIKRYDKEQIRRQEVRPGITGWAQINGRNSINWEDKFKLDIFYVNNLSFFFDLKILLITVKIIIQQKGISNKGYLTMPKFTGNK